MAREVTAATLGAVGLAGGALWQIAEQYRANAPSLASLRNAESCSTEHRQALMDTDVLTGIMTLAAGGLAWRLTGSPWPMIIVGSAFLVVSCYHHAVLRGPTAAQIQTGVSQ